jgi:hypothetical protein
MPCRHDLTAGCPVNDTAIVTQVAGKAPKRKATPELNGDGTFMALVGGVVDSATDESGWTRLEPAGNNLTTTEPDFDSRNAGCSKFSDLLEFPNPVEVTRQDQVVRVAAPP